MPEYWSRQYEMDEPMDARCFAHPSMTLNEGKKVRERKKARTARALILA
jgi:hypothetical protein